MSPASISAFRRTCQIVNGWFAGFRHDIRTACHHEIGGGASGSGSPTSSSVRNLSCWATTPLAVAETPVNRLWKFVTKSSGALRNATGTLSGAVRLAEHDCSRPSGRAVVTGELMLDFRFDSIVRGENYPIGAGSNKINFPR